MAVTLTFRTSEVQLDAVTIDATVTETHSSDVEITQHPIENGAKVSDHILLRPKSLRLDIVLADFPLGANRDSGYKGRAAATYRELEGLQQAGTLTEVETGIKSYRNMAIKRLSTPRTAETGGTLRVSASLEEVRLVDTQLVPVTVTRLRKGEGMQNGGPKSGDAATTQEQSKSFAAMALDALAGDDPPEALVKRAVR